VIGMTWRDMLWLIVAGHNMALRDVLWRCGAWSIRACVRLCRRIPRIQMKVGESAEFEDPGGSKRAFVELRGIRQTPKLEAATECTRHGKC
jgi:hypothetical protein